jgi:TonB family protein
VTDDRASAPTPGKDKTSSLVVPHTPTKTTRAVAAEAKLASIFAADLAEHVVANVAKLIPGAQTARAPADTQRRSRKTALESGGADQRPAMSGFAGSSLSSGARAVGRVEHTIGLDRANFRARQLPVVIAPSLENATADATELGAFVRGRVAQLQSCYERAGGTDLAGVVALRLTIGAGGTMRSAEIVRRTWSGPGAADAEACLIKMARGWHMVSAQEGATVTLPISFTRGG